MRPHSPVFLSDPHFTICLNIFNQRLLSSAVSPLVYRISIIEIR